MAGIGSRLGKSMPKCLTELPNGETILGRQIRLLKPYNDEVIGVVGFKKELIMEMYPGLLYVYNPLFIQNNTAKSLFMAMESIEEDDIVRINGDVVFSEDAFKRFAESSGDSIAVEFKEVMEEEVKFTTDKDGYIQEISKEVEHGLGEAVGINRIEKNHFEKLKIALKKCGEMDYFEKAIELCVKDGVKFKAVDIGSHQCVEIDFIEDLDRAWKIIERDL